MAEVVRDHAVAMGKRGGRDHQIVLRDRLAGSEQVGPYSRVYSSNFQIVWKDRNVCENRFNELYSLLAPFVRIGALSSEQHLSCGYAGDGNGFALTEFSQRANRAPQTLDCDEDRRVDQSGHSGPSDMTSRSARMASRSSAKRSSGLGLK